MKGLYESVLSGTKNVLDTSKIKPTWDLIWRKHVAIDACEGFKNQDIRIADNGDIYSNENGKPHKDCDRPQPAGHELGGLYELRYLSEYFRGAFPDLWILAENVIISDPEPFKEIIQFWADWVSYCFKTLKNLKEKDVHIEYNIDYSNGARLMWSNTREEDINLYFEVKDNRFTKFMKPHKDGKYYVAFTKSDKYDALETDGATGYLNLHYWVTGNHQRIDSLKSKLASNGIKFHAPKINVDDIRDMVINICKKNDTEREAKSSII